VRGTAWPAPTADRPPVTPFLYTCKQERTARAAAGSVLAQTCQPLDVVLDRPFMGYLDWKTNRRLRREHRTAAPAG